VMPYITDFLSRNDPSSKTHFAISTDTAEIPKIPK